MIVTRLIGGLGNQLFQYAAGRMLAYKLKTKLKLDITSFEHYKLRTYRLSNFFIKEVFATQADIQTFDSRPRSRSDKIVKRLIEITGLPVKRKTVFREPVLGLMNQDLFSASGDVYLDGYWQSEKYFAEIENVIRDEARVKQPLDQYNHKLIGYIQSINSVSLHVRRGDYVSDPSTNSVHGICDNQYYINCANEIAAKVNNPHYFIFSDDSEWVSKNLHLPYPTTYISHNGQERDFEDLRLMSACKHHIIANSSFSWWGAWLGRYSEKIVYAPKRWFNSSEIDDRDLIPERWVRL